MNSWPAWACRSPTSVIWTTTRASPGPKARCGLRVSVPRRTDSRGDRLKVEATLSDGLATEVMGLISAGKEANVYLARYNGAPLAVKSYRLYRTSHRGGGPLKQDSMGWRAAHEYEMMRQAWKGGVRVPTPARRVENRFSMRYLGTEEGPAPRLKDVRIDVAASANELVESLDRFGVLH